eukprot:TRINITY_DN27610_c0_g1_i1.p1 TRINITY_DN27610_c0_g1~~TRINITY_DN27610_c0_g1_i1.p1  ORF type:complete len:120 (-),score=19.95 TRINITY_DN27610_c0_g1_i1:425-784(-)
MGQPNVHGMKKSEKRGEKLSSNFAAEMPDKGAFQVPCQPGNLDRHGHVTCRRFLPGGNPMLKANCWHSKKTPPGTWKAPLIRTKEVCHQAGGHLPPCCTWTEGEGGGRNEHRCKNKPRT